MAKYEFKRTARKCYETQREFDRGEEFFSALIDTDAGPERRDFGHDIWKGPADDCIGWWKSTVPLLEAGRVYWAPSDVLLAYFENLAGKAIKDATYVMGLLLVRKRLLQLVETDDEAEGGPLMILRNRKTKEKIEIPVVELTAERMIQIQDELAENLFMDRPDGAAADDDAQPMD